jgi:hypothetical protein
MRERRISVEAEAGPMVPTIFVRERAGAEVAAPEDVRCVTIRGFAWGSRDM